MGTRLRGRAEFAHARWAWRRTGRWNNQTQTAVLGLNASIYFFSNNEVMISLSLGSFAIGCRELYGDFRCICRAGYTGERCDRWVLNKCCFHFRNRAGFILPLILICFPQMCSRLLWRPAGSGRTLQALQLQRQWQQLRSWNRRFDSEPSNALIHIWISSGLLFLNPRVL